MDALVVAHGHLVVGVLCGVFAVCVAALFAYIKRDAHHDASPMPPEGDALRQTKRSKKANDAFAVKKDKGKKVSSGDFKKDDKEAQTKEWHVTTLKGHLQRVLDMDLSSNGKFLATCAQVNEFSPPSSTSSSCSSSMQSSPRLSRRQKKNRRHVAPPQPPVITIVNIDPEVQLANCLRQFQLTASQLCSLGFPVASSIHPGKTIIYQQTPRANSTLEVYDLQAQLATTSGSGSGSSDESDDCTRRPLAVPQVPLVGPGMTTQAHCCSRCSRHFLTTSGGGYLSLEPCTHHWGKLRAVYPQAQSFSCCGHPASHPGCTRSKLHVWKGLAAGCNGPYDDFLSTVPNGNRLGALGYAKHYPVLAIDCEMCYTPLGLEATRVTLVDARGDLVYDSYVRPQQPIIDYNTRFSGILPQHIYGSGSRALDLRTVQRDLLELIGAETVLVGHGLENDLRAVKLVHACCVDTSVVFPHRVGLPLRRSLRALAAQFLGKHVQFKGRGHDSYEDAWTAMQLMLTLVV